MKGLSVFHHWLRVLICALAVIVLAGCSGQATKTPAHLPSVRVLSARDHLEEAWQLAKQWRDDAQLKEIQVSVIGPEQVVPPYIDFTFESPSEDDLKFYVSCFAGGCSGRALRVSITSGWGAIEFDEDMIDSIEAATIGLQNGGERFAYVERGATLTVSLVRDIPRDAGPTVWEAFFGTLYEEPLYVVIDPYTGEVIRTE